MITVLENVPMGSGMTMFNSWVVFKYRKEFGITAPDKQPKFNRMYVSYDIQQALKELKKKAKKIKYD